MLVFFIIVLVMIFYQRFANAYNANLEKTRKIQNDNTKTTLQKTTVKKFVPQQKTLNGWVDVGHGIYQNPTTRERISTGGQRIAPPTIKLPPTPEALASEWFSQHEENIKDFWCKNSCSKTELFLDFKRLPHDKSLWFAVGKLLQENFYCYDYNVQEKGILLQLV